MLPSRCFTQETTYCIAVHTERIIPPGSSAPARVYTPLLQRFHFASVRSKTAPQTERRRRVKRHPQRFSTNCCVQLVRGDAVAHVCRRHRTFREAPSGKRTTLRSWGCTPRICVGKFDG